MTTTSFTCSVQRVVAQARPYPTFHLSCSSTEQSRSDNHDAFSVEEWDSSGVNVLKC